MSANSSAKGYEPHLLLNGYPWESIGKGVVVDLGGSQGSVAISIAERYPQLNCVVQDLPKVIEQGQAALPKELAGRVSFMAQYVCSRLITLTNERPVIFSQTSLLRPMLTT